MSPAVHRYSARGAKVKGRRRDLARGSGSGGLIVHLNIQGQIPPLTHAPPLRATIDSIWPESKLAYEGDGKSGNAAALIIPCLPA